MIIPLEIIDKLVSDTDADTQAVARIFDEPEGSRVLEVGAHDEPLSNILADLGFDVTGVDLREYDSKLPKCNYRYLRQDFCDAQCLKDEKPFDIFVSISCIEHFGLGTYQEGMFRCYYDVLAMRKAWELLKEGGSVYITVPFGKDYIENMPHWRVYDNQSVLDRIVQDFDIVGGFVFISGKCFIGEELCDIGHPITIEQAKQYCGVPPHVSILLKMTKTSKTRLAPNDR